VFDQCYRYFALGSARLITNDYHVVNLITDWQVESGPATLEPAGYADRTAAVARYNLQDTTRFRITANCVTDLDLANAETGFKRIELSYRGDLSWHDMRVYVEMDGRTWKTESPKYIATDQWSEIQVQLPGTDDQRLIPRRYARLADIGLSDVTEPGLMKVSVELNRSGTARAYWAKGTENYRRAFDEVPFWRYFKTSVFLVAVNIIGTLVSCSLVAYAFARLNWPGRDLCFLLVLATLMIPPQVTMIPSFVIYKHLGWYNTLAPLWIPNALAVNGFAIFLLRQAMKGIPKDLEEAAKIDGCSHLRIWWHITLPLVKPTMAAIAIFTFMFVWNDFMTPLIYVNDQRLYPLSLGLFSFMAGRENQFTLIMAGSMIMTLPVIITFFLAQRYFIQGVAMSGMKN
jgi:multiple sugar transport system permease protein